MKPWSAYGRVASLSHRDRPGRRQGLDAVREVDLDIHRGETVGLVGESGSGKTTLGRLCLGMQRPSRGTVHD